MTPLGVPVSDLAKVAVASLVGTSSREHLHRTHPPQTAFFIARKIYAILTHPLRKFPGPFLCGISNAPYSYWFNGGRRDFIIKDLHEKYGPVVRIAPDELSFATPQSFRDIYGFRTAPHSTFPKSRFYDGSAFSSYGVHGIITARDPAEHAQMRRHLSHAFSERALREQEGLVAEIVDEFVKIVGNMGAEGKVVDFEWWLRCCMFDVTGSLAFGRGFDALKNGGQHPSLKFVVEAMKQLSLIDTMTRFPYLGKVFALFFARKLLKLLRGSAMHEEFALSIVRERIANPTTRPDILTRLQENLPPNTRLPDIQLATHVCEILIAGSDTSNTTMGTVFNYVLRDPSLYSRLTTTIRSHFSSYDKINALEAAKVEMLRSIIQESMRILPPVPGALNRLVPEGGDTVDGFFVPGGTYVTTQPLATALSPLYFDEPMKFKPERWERSSKGKDILEASQPFSLGPRGCLGQNLAWMEMNTILCKVFWKLDLELVNTDMDLHRDSKLDSLWDKPPLLIKVSERRD
ncbi:cytochrome P450 [Polyplosphaeria fusca]|uniref:Cytochrome P450 n=1 Tax=Polyplosphaeria fusca TaxID=682080 RepID=A0A9P4QKC9_9PLEO|nr:cytochrome P450 [Polyplosphaeria fusca]